MKWWENRQRAKKERLEAANKMGRDFGDNLFKKVEKFGDTRLDEIAIKHLSVFKNQLETVYDDPDHEPKIIAAIEGQIFSEQTEQVLKIMWSETQEFCAEEVPHVGELEDPLINELLADIMEQRIEASITMMIAGAKALYDMKIEEIEDKKDQLKT